MGLSSWIKRKIDRRVSDQAADELNQFLIRIEGLDNKELGLVAAQAADVCARMHAEAGIDLLNPVAVIAESPHLGMKITSTVINMQKKGMQATVPGMMVWMHTLRAEDRLELRHAAKEMWRVIARGFPHAELAAFEFETLTGLRLEIDDDFLRVPNGF
jgi:hypothetical protein